MEREEFKGPASRVEEALKVIEEEWPILALPSKKKFLMRMLDLKIEGLSGEVTHPSSFAQMAREYKEW